MERYKHEPDPHKIAEALGCNVSTVKKYLKNIGHIHFSKADQYAIRLGLHPFLIWGEEWVSPSLPSSRKRPQKKE